ncbi:TetR/AcrR family transcriptional regulator [Nocardia flavorosea]|uniref:TetR/AcrR family transcriptional regulator n=1 Tax=Nocardia flavorosea TaxID=53429 RepID=A0A846YNE3_9NOCA|nr:TetR/AcrR family transcriptional regulator [Nocardia flavorosea]NKY58439.1 TetR/AcrR family transcriptional regulator [Nocardia flavorosea]
MVDNDDDMPPRRLTRTESKARTRQRLLDAAARTFARKGYGAASVDEIAEAAGYSVGAVYSNFGSKEHLFTELMSNRVTDRVGEAARIVADTETTAEERMGALGRMLIEIADKDQDLAPLQAEFWLYAVRNPATMDLLAERTSPAHEGVRALVEDSLRRRDIGGSAESEALATVVLALFQGLVRQRRIDPNRVPDELFGSALTWLFEGIAATQTSENTDPRK